PEVALSETETSPTMSSSGCVLFIAVVFISILIPDNGDSADMAAARALAQYVVMKGCAPPDPGLRWQCPAPYPVDPRSCSDRNCAVRSAPMPAHSWYFQWRGPVAIFPNGFP